MDDSSDFLKQIEGFEEAIKQEYEVATSTSDIATIRTLIEQKIAKALPGFVDDLILIARAGDTDSSRLKAISFAFNWYFKESASADDPFSKLLNDLTALPTATQNKQTTTEPEPSPPDEPAPDPVPTPDEPEPVE